MLNSLKQIGAMLLIMYLCIETSIKAQQHITEKIQYLSGTGAKNTQIWDFMVTQGRNSNHWTSIAVPSHWEQQGFGTYNYGRDNITFGKNFLYANEQGFYKRNFMVDSSWKGQQVFLVFEGVMTDAEVRVNGKLVGPIHQGAFYEFKYDVSNWLKFGEQNKVEVKVSKMSAESSVNRAERLADYWIFGGIYRPVYLSCRPIENIDWTAIDAKADGSFRLSAHLNNPIGGRILQAEIIDDKGIIVGSARGVISYKDSNLVLKTHVKLAKLWTAETPNLYTIRLTIKKGNQAIYQSIDKFGFRTIEVRKGDGIYLNGTKIKMKGINRHVFWPDYGRTTYPEADFLDVKLMKEMNLNAVRCSHYPPDKSFLRACDSLGLYVIDELAGWQKAYSTKVGKLLVREMLIRDVNHPSIIFWSNGNEGGHNMDLVSEFAKYDISHRAVIHAHHKPGHAINGIDCNHYEDYYSTQKILSESNIYMPTEFLHGLHDGGAAAGLADFWELHWHAKRGAGGFIWNYADEAVLRSDRNNQLDANGYNGPDGVVGPYRQKEGSAYAMKEIYSPVKIRMEALPADFGGKIELENRYHFTNLRHCTFHWELLRLRGDQIGSIVVQSGVTQVKDIAPTKKGHLLLPLPADWRTADILALKAVDPYGAEIYRWTWQIKTNQALLMERFTYPLVEASPEVYEKGSSLTIKTGAIALTFDQKTGLLSMVKSSKGSILSFNGGPVLVSGTATFDHLNHRREEGRYIVEMYYKGDLDRIKWTIQPNGLVLLNYFYNLNGKYLFAGVSFNYPESLVTGIKWLGRGPGRVWKNRLQGQSLDVFEKQYNSTSTGRSPWIYPEFNGYYANVVWMQLQTMEGSFMIGSPDKDLFVRLFDFHAIYGVNPHPQLPVGNISFLDRIPATGSNLKTGVANDVVSNMGPSSGLNVLDRPVERTLYFYFGIPKPNLAQKE